MITFVKVYFGPFLCAFLKMLFIKYAEILRNFALDDGFQGCFAVHIFLFLQFCFVIQGGLIL